MTTKAASPMNPHAIASSDDVKRAFGAIEDRTIAEILAMHPSLRDLSDAAVWQRGEGDLIAREHRELTREAQAVIDIIARAGEEWPEDER
jgi:hypothetical protein